MTYYIYILLKNDSVFYVGTSIRPQVRIQKHYQTLGFKPDMEIIDETEAVCQSDVRHLEGYWIWQFRSWGFTLLNKQLIVDRMDFFKHNRSVRA